GFDSSKKTMMFVGGSLGAKSINDIVHENIDELTKDFQVIHITGAGNIKDDLQSENYRQYEFVQHELPHLFKMSDVVIYRSGSNATYELLLLKNALLLIPLQLAQIRGDQQQNAHYYKSKGDAEVIEEDELPPKQMIDLIKKLAHNNLEYIKQMEQ